MFRIYDDGKDLIWVTLSLNKIDFSKSREFVEIVDVIVVWFNIWYVFFFFDI